MSVRCVPMAGVLLVGGFAYAAAQVPLPGEVEFAVYGGGISFGDFHDHAVLIVPAGAEGQRYRRSITARTSSSVGAAMTVWIHPLWGVRLHHASVDTRFADRFEEEAERLLAGDPEFVALPSTARLAVSTQDVSVIFRVPARIGELGAYALGGVGRIRYSVPAGDAAAIPPGAGEAFGNGGRFSSIAGVGGAGAHYPLGRLRLLAEVTNHIGRSPVRSVGETDVFVSEEFVVRTVPARTGDQATPGQRSERVNTLRVMLGLTISFR